LLHIEASVEAATQPNPANNAAGVALDATLSWWPGIAAVSHRVFFGTTSPPTLIGRTTELSLDPGPLELDTTYYWRVDTVAADGTIHTGDIWSFMTERGNATQPNPADGATGVSMTVTLSWTPDIAAATHDVYFGTTSPPAFIGNQTATTYDPGALDLNTTYYWQINEVEADGTTTHAGDIWSFTTEHGKATQPDPPDGATNVVKLVTLSWTPGITAASHDVYFSADQQAVIDGTAPVTNVTEASYSPGMLEKGKTYYWRVDAVEADGTTKHTGDVWSFTVTTAGR
jgi:hypothetical protein